MLIADSFSHLVSNSRQVSGQGEDMSSVVATLFGLAAYMHVVPIASVATAYEDLNKGWLPRLLLCRG
jgi:hypothetical protein